jgi:hypothetical protein
MPTDRWQQSVKDQVYRRRKKAGLPRLLSEGDSWFAYPMCLNIVDYIDDTERFAIKRVEQSGDKLRDILDSGEFFPLIHSESPRCLIFSGGGNDLVEQPFVTQLFLPPKPGGTAQDMLDRATVWGPKLQWFDQQFERLMMLVDRRLPVLVHGYDYLIPSPQGVRYDGFALTGPWVQPAMLAKGITDPKDQRAVARIVIDDFNTMLQSVAARWPNHMSYLNLRGTLEPGSEWANEMHPKAAGFKKVAAKFIAKLQELVP